MYRWWLVCTLAIFILIWKPYSVSAESDRLSLQRMLPNPVGTDTNAEWVEVINPGSASVSAVGYWMRDGNGTPKIVPLTGEWSAGESKQITGLSLNNDTDWVELWQGETLLEVSAPYTAAQEDALWVKNGTGQWQWWQANDESPMPSPSTAPYPTAVPPPLSARPIPSVASSMPLSSAVTESIASAEASTLQPFYAWGFPVLQSSTTSGSGVSMITRPSVRPTPDFSAEEEVYFQWKKQAWLANVLLLWGGGVCVILVSPWWWKWYLRARMWW